MSDITLSAGVRQNLLSLQNTADLMATTQNRLATGKKVNSALDNPTSFFTASSLQTRSNDLSALMDSMSNGIKTLEAADNGLTAITKSLESMQSTLRQARQDKTFDTATFTIDLGATPTGAETMSFAGGSVGDTAISVALSTNTGGTLNAATAGAITAGTFATVNTDDAVDSSATISAGTFSDVNIAGSKATTSFDGFDGPLDFTTNTNNGSVEFKIATDSGTADTITIDYAKVNGNVADNAAVTKAELVDLINTELGSAANASATASINTDGDIVFTSTDGNAGTSSDIQITAVAEVDLGGGTETSGLTTEAAVTTGVAATIDFTITVDGDEVDISLDNTMTASDKTAVTAEEMAAEINSQINTELSTTSVEYVTVDGTSGNLVFTSNTDTSSSTLAISDYTEAGTTGMGIVDTTEVKGGDAGSSALTFTLNVDGTDHAITIDEDTTATDSSAITAAELATAINAQVGSTVATVNTDGDLTFTSTTTGAGSSITISDVETSGGATAAGIVDATKVTGVAASYTGGTNAAKTVDELVATINNTASLKGKVRATNDSGKLRIENQSTQEMTVTGASGGTADGGTGTSTIDGNEVRSDLATQYNELRDQLDKLSDDASYNGVNLLRGDNLKLTFNETDTSIIDIQTKNGETMNAAYLKISDIDAQDLDSDAGIDKLIANVKVALNTVRSQASSFGSNLSIVENRKEFTTAMMNTLQTGADNLILADGNEEAANMLALQTRQQLSSTALSLASQADQTPLQLF